MEIRDWLFASITNTVLLKTPLKKVDETSNLFNKAIIINNKPKNNGQIMMGIDKPFTRC